MAKVVLNGGTAADTDILDILDVNIKDFGTIELKELCLKDQLMSIIYEVFKLEASDAVRSRMQDLYRTADLKPFAETIAQEATKKLLVRYVYFYIIGLSANTPESYQRYLKPLYERIMNIKV